MQFFSNIRTIVACAAACATYTAAPAMASQSEDGCSYIEVDNVCPTTEVDEERTMHINLNHGDQFVWAHIGEETLYVSYVGDKRRVLHGISRMIDTETDATMIADYTAIMEAIEKNDVFPFDAVMAFSDAAEVPQYLEQMKAREKERNREQLMLLLGIPSPRAVLQAQALSNLLAPRCPETGCVSAGPMAIAVSSADSSSKANIDVTVEND